MDDKETTQGQDDIQMNPEEPTVVEKNTFMAILSYIGPLVIIPFLTAKDDPFVYFHIRQGLMLFIAEVALWFLMATFWFLFPIWQIINLVIFVLAVIGIINAIGGKEKELPIVGKYAKSIKI